MKTLTVLGSTGSIGTQTLDVCRRSGYYPAVLTANRNVKLLEEQIREFHPKIAVLADDSAAADLRVRVADTDTRVLPGRDICEAAAYGGSDIAVSAIVGIAGLEPTVSAIKAGKSIALANKETLVTAGPIVKSLAREYGVSLLPVDSEHSAIFQSMQGRVGNKVKSIILTASGGPFFGYTADRLRSVTKEQALLHPSWSMGAKITVDSATMMNKGLEIIEAAYLFDVSPDIINVVIHRESIIHSAVEFEDNSVIAQLGNPDMRIPIQYALTYPERRPSGAERLSLADIGRMTFYPPDDAAFPAMNVCRRAYAAGGCAPAAVSGANEAAVSLFLQGRIGFCRITELAETAAAEIGGEISDIQDVLDADKAARELVYSRA